MLKADLHLHAAEDSSEIIRYPAKKLIEVAAKHNFNVLSFTFHDAYFYPKHIVDYAKKKGILLIPGIELTIEGAHVLVYNITKRESISLHTFKDLASLKKKRGSSILIIAPHPYFLVGHCLGNRLEQHIQLFDAIEYCHFYMDWINLNKKAVAIAKKYHKPLVGNSDTHHLFQFHTTYSLIDAQLSVSSIFDAIRKNKLNIISAPLSLSAFTKVFLWASTSPLLNRHSPRKSI